MRNRIKRAPKQLLFLSLAVLLIAFLVPSQKSQAQNRKLQKAIENYDYQFYNEAIDLLKDVLKEDKHAYKPLKYLANSYRKVKDYQNAELYFTLLVNSDSAQAEDFLYYGQALKSNGKLAAAKEQFIKFSETSESSFLGKLMLQSIDQIDAWEDQPKNYRSIKLEGLNSESSEYGAVLFKNKIYITSDREEDLNSTEKFSWNDKPFLSIYELDTALIHTESPEFQEVNGKINTIYHDGPLSVDTVNDRAMITRVDNQLRGIDFVNRMKLYEGTYIGGKWKKFKAFPFNSNDYSVGHAHYADSGNTVYFASDMPGGYGGMDLYVSYRENGSWSSPANLGAVINTSKNEVFPFLMGNELYFSSNGFPGYGELDILVSALEEEEWQAPQNLKSPINSNRDDFAIFFINDTTGYYASNREGGKGLDDIYQFIKYGDNIEITGIFEFEGLPIANTKVKLMDANDSLIAEGTTDADGLFVFKNLTYQENYVFKIDSDDPELVEEGRIYITDKKGEKIRLIERIKSGDFIFTALPIGEVKEIEAIRAKDDRIVNELKFVGQVFEVLPGDVEEEVMVYLTDTSGVVIDSTMSDDQGLFEFSKLPKNANYLIKVKAQDTELNLAFINDMKRVYNTKKIDKDGKVLIKPELDASRLITEATNKGYTTLIAKLENKGAPVTNQIIEIFDQNDSLISTVITNEKGEFQYNQLEYDKHYFIKIPNRDESLSDESLLYIVKEDGTPMYLINLIESGIYEFESLPYDEYDNVIEEELKSVPQKVDLAGQIYNTESEESKEGLTVYLVNEDGEVLDSTETDKDGGFKFEKLNPEVTYSFQLSGQTDEYTLALLDAENKIVETSRPSKDGTFKYKKLTYQVAQFIPLSPKEVEVVEVKYNHTVEGKIFQKLPGDLGAGVKVFLYDEGGELIKSTYTDSAGNFTFTRLDEQQNYVFRINEIEDDLQIVTLGEDQKPTNTTILKNGKSFTYSPLAFIENTVKEKEAAEEGILFDDKNVVYTDEQVNRIVASKRGDDGAGKFMVFYDYDKSNLDEKARKRLNDFILLFAEDDFKIEVSSFTDNRGSQAYNLALSKRRTNSVTTYLSQNGIDKARIKGNYFGELKPIIDCDHKNCTEAEHRINRRSEIAVDE